MPDREGPSDSLVDLSRADLVSVLDAVTDVLYVFTPDNNFQTWNDALIQVTGYSEHEIADMSPGEFFEGDDRERVSAAFSRVIEDGTRATVEANIVTKDGTEIPYEFTGVRLRVNEAGETLIAGIGRDISERVERERQLQLQNERLEEFTAVVSHDLRNPIDVAHARLDLAGTECDSEHLDVAQESLRRMARIVEDSLELANQGQFVTDADWIRLQRAARNAWRQVDTASALLETVGDTKLHADEDRIQHIFENLFRNAVQHGGETVQVTVGSMDDGFYVADDGDGIDPENRDQIFDPGVTYAPDGTGFGLSIVRRVAEAHGWEPRATESADGGARFEFTGVETRPV